MTSMRLLSFSLLVLAACGGSTASPADPDASPGPASSAVPDAGVCSGDLGAVCAPPNVCPAGPSMADAIAYMCAFHGPSVTVGCNVVFSENTYTTRYQFDDNGVLIGTLYIPDTAAPDQCAGESGLDFGYSCTTAVTYPYDRYCLSDGAVNPEGGS
jgi:hypothetical protein